MNRNSNTTRSTIAEKDRERLLANVRSQLQLATQLLMWAELEARDAATCDLEDVYDEETVFDVDSDADALRRIVKRLKQREQDLSC